MCSHSGRLQQSISNRHRARREKRNGRQVPASDIKQTVTVYASSHPLITSETLPPLSRQSGATRESKSMRVLGWQESQIGRIACVT
jgi:hypothetical protein